MTTTKSTSDTPLFERGRPAWYNAKPLIVGITGGTASGKTSVCHKIINQLSIPWVALLSLDAFYKPLPAHVEPSDFNWDHPDAFDYDLFVSTLKRLKCGRTAEIPRYNFCTNSREPEGDVVYGADVIIMEGILLFHDKRLRDQCDVKIFVDTDSDVRLLRRVRRDISERGRDLEGVLQQYVGTVKPMFDEFVFPTKQFCDIILPRGSDNDVAINLLSQHIENELKKRGHDQKKVDSLHTIERSELPDNLKILPNNNQIESLMTCIRDRNTIHSDFVFDTNRVVRLLAEMALSTMRWKKKVVVTPTGSEYHGVEFNDKLCIVSIMRAGEAMEEGVREVCKDIRIGKLLIQSRDKQPRLFYKGFPPNIDERKVLLLDPMLATASTARMAVQVLLDHGVKAENISYLTIVASTVGVYNLVKTHPGVNILAVQLDRELNSVYHILPGCGNYGDRYFGTEDVEHQPGALRRIYSSLTAEPSSPAALRRYSSGAPGSPDDLRPLRRGGPTSLFRVDSN